MTTPFSRYLSGRGGGRMELEWTMPTCPPVSFITDVECSLLQIVLQLSALAWPEVEV
ncbi:hypothetical protein D3C85_1538450 [compost metagenome]